jgi:hypothetical protein
MTNDPLRPHRDPPSLPRTGAGVLAASIAAAAIVGLLTLMQSTPPGVQALVPANAANAPPQGDNEPLDTGVDWQHMEHMPEPHGASVAAYER